MGSRHFPRLCRAETDKTFLRTNSFSSPFWCACNVILILWSEHLTFNSNLTLIYKKHLHLTAVPSEHIRFYAFNINCFLNNISFICNFDLQKCFIILTFPSLMIFNKTLYDVPYFFLLRHSKTRPGRLVVESHSDTKCPSYVPVLCSGAEWKKTQRGTNFLLI